ncbi:DUF6520 family protein [Chitinophaga silvisoli]|uniref:Uncharacterized protein n=1 Tax=Chitinophaga silvisoli TaxID=2291814 RepID=A0A3E1P3D4_9BACT|nr:DUF6520 family protein [Chitinophaga silvisoli]RFM34682.1 hypothetical protein DXN04_15570 [Chitinophaga silvisoli]
MKKHMMTAIAVVFAIGSAFAGSRVATGWYLNPTGTGTPITEAQATAMCPNGSANPCAYHFTQGASTYDQVKYYAL